MEIMKSNIFNSYVNTRNMYYLQIFMTGGEIMQLNTTSYQSILDSLCNELDLNEQVILDTIDSGYYMFQQDHQILYIDDLYECYFNIVKNHFKEHIDKV